MNFLRKTSASQALTLTVIVSAIGFAAACGDSKSSMNPVAPSAVVSSAHNFEAGASGGVVSTTGGPKPGNGNGNGNGNSGGGNGNGNGNSGGGNGNGNGNSGGGNGNGGGGNGNGNGHDQPTVPTPPTIPGNITPPTNTTPSAPQRVELEGLISAKGAGSITVNGQLVMVPASAAIRHGSRQFTFADLHVGDRVHVKAMRTTTGTGPTATTTLEATEVKLQNPGGEDDDEDEATNLVSVAAFDPMASETGLDPGVFRFTRSGDLTAALTVTFTLAGTATNGSDYATLLLTAAFAAGQATTNVSVMPLADLVAEAPETVVLTVVDGPGYTAGAPATATITILP